MLLSLSLVHVVYGQSAGIIVTYAGSGTCAYSSAYGSSTAFYSQTYLSLDPQGNVVLADYYNNRVRLLNQSSGIITTIAGNGAVSSSGDRGAATSASIHGPYHAIYDNSGNLYIAEYDGSRVRIVSPAGIISTFAGTGLTSGAWGDGGLATQARVDNPVSLAYYQGSIYISAWTVGCIRQVILSTNIISTVAGICGSQGFSGDGGLAVNAQLGQAGTGPSYILFDGGGNMLISDPFNNRVRKVDTSGYISTIAGTGSSTISGDNGLAVYAGIPLPFQLAFDASGDLYIGLDKHVVRKITMSNGIISAVTGNGTASSTGDGGSALLATVNRPRGLAFTTAGDLLVSEVGGGYFS